ncbi:MAG: ribosome silencing factor [Firmicutes bacterium]|nr:ribosome silencing factor [Bacillota bacterium]
MAEMAARLAYEKKASDIIILEMEENSDICDYFVVVSGTSRVHNKAIADNIIETFKQEDRELRKNVQGRNEGGWILLDFGSVIVHIFLDNLRGYYNLEGLWKNAKVIQPDFEAEQLKEETV